MLEKRARMHIPVLLVILLATSAAFAVTDCDKNRFAPPRCEANIFGDGPHLINVPQRVQTSDGAVYQFIDNVWIDVHSDPEGEDRRLPIVVIGPGAGRSDWGNCYPDRSPIFSGDTTNLARLGYVAIYVGYRIHGAGAPRVGTLKLRDHWILDARSLLAAAQWGRTCHQKGGQQVAFVGFSMGTWPAYWAVSENKDLTGLQTCLDIRTVVLAGEFANYFSRSRTQPLNLENWNDNWSLGEKLTKITRNGYRVLEAFSAPALSQLPQIQYKDLTSGDLGRNLRTVLEPPAIELMKATLFEEADKHLDGCYELHNKPPVCGERCFHSTLQKFAVGLEDPTEPGKECSKPEEKCFWVKPEYNQAAKDWGAVCPTKDERGNLLVDAWYKESPTCSATGPLKIERALALASHNDKFYNPCALNQLARSLQNRGIPKDNLECPQISEDHGFRCGHFDYFKPDLPGCGWEYVTKALMAAFQSQPLSTSPKSNNQRQSYKICAKEG